MLARDVGATISEIVEETGWKSNTVHSALSTLRTGGREILLEDADGKRRYKIA